MTNIKFIYGLEIHVQLNTKCKLFSHAANDSYAVENQNVSLIDLGITGTYPILNVHAVIKAIRACFMMKTSIASDVTFDRKHYKYLDLPSSYQITQFDNPIGINGEYSIGNGKVITIKDIHMECDAAKTKEYDNKIVIDYNRCGAPLIEIVTNPCFSDVLEIETFLNLLIQDLRINNISEARFEMSQIRADVNISMNVDGVQSPRLEIKNLNSIRSIKRAVTLTQHMLKTENIDGDYTVHYDDIHNTVTLARKKESALEYMYLHEYAIPAVSTSKFILASQQDPISLTIIAIDKITSLTAGKLDKGVINAIITEADVRNLVDKYILKHGSKNLIPAIGYIMEIKELFDSIEGEINLLVVLIQKVVNKEILKVNMIELAKLILAKDLETEDELDQYIKGHNMLILSTQLDVDKVKALLIQNDSEIIDRLANPRVFSFCMGLIFANIPGTSPQEAARVLTVIKNENSNN